MSKHKLPAEIRHLVHARNQLRERYKHLNLKFTLDGNLIGDLGEAVAAELFGLSLVGVGANPGIDGYDREGRSVQVKATGRGKTFAFTHSGVHADRLIALVFNYEAEEVEVVYDGNYSEAISKLPSSWVGQKPVTVSWLRGLMPPVD